MGDQWYVDFRRWKRRRRRAATKLGVFFSTRSLNFTSSRAKRLWTDAVDNWWMECNAQQIRVTKDTNKKQKTDIQPCLVRLPCGHATLYILLKSFGATVRATIDLHSRSKNLCTIFTCLLMTWRKGKFRRHLECCTSYTKGLFLTRFGLPTSVFMARHG